MEKGLKDNSLISSSESNIYKLEEKRNRISREISALHDDRDEIRSKIAKDPTVCCPDLEDEVREINKKLTALHKSLDEIKNSKEKGNAALDKARRELRARLVSSADIILCTLSGSGHEMFSEIRDLKFETV
jgi:senataxin